MQERTIDRLEAPYTSNCTRDWTLSNFTSLVHNETIFPYNILQCRRFCLFDHFKSQCGCFYPTYLDSDSNRNDTLPCNIIRGSSDFVCVENVINEIDDGQR